MLGWIEEGVMGWREEKFVSLGNVGGRVKGERWVG